MSQSFFTHTLDVLIEGVARDLTHLAVWHALGDVECLAERLSLDDRRWEVAVDAHAPDSIIHVVHCWGRIVRGGPKKNMIPDCSKVDEGGMAAASLLRLGSRASVSR